MFFGFSRPQNENFHDYQSSPCIVWWRTKNVLDCHTCNSNFWDIWESNDQTFVTITTLQRNFSCLSVRFWGVSWDNAGENLLYVSSQFFVTGYRKQSTCCCDRQRNSLQQEECINGCFKKEISFVCSTYVKFNYKWSVKQ